MNQMFVLLVMRTGHPIGIYDEALWSADAFFTDYKSFHT